MLKRISKIVYFVSGGLSIFCSVMFCVLGILSIVLAFSPDFLDTLYNSMTNSASIEKEDFILAARAIYICISVFAFIYTIFAAANAVVSFVGAIKPRKQLHILNIVFGALSGVELNIAAAILGLIASRNE